MLISSTCEYQLRILSCNPLSGFELYPHPPPPQPQNPPNNPFSHHIGGFSSHVVFLLLISRNTFASAICCAAPSKRVWAWLSFSLDIVAGNWPSGPVLPRRTRWPPFPFPLRGGVSFLKVPFLCEHRAPPLVFLRRRVFQPDTVLSGKTSPVSRCSLSTELPKSST